MTFMIVTSLSKNVYPNSLSATRTHHTGNGCIPENIGNGNLIGSEPEVTRRKRGIIEPESLNANEVNEIRKQIFNRIKNKKLWEIFQSKKTS